jgi:putative membrane protein
MMLNRILFAGSAALLALSTPAFAQMATATTGTAGTADVGVEPMGAMPAGDYVKMAAASDNYEIQAARIALTKSSRPDVKAYAKMMIDAHTASSKTLMAALSNSERKITRPSMALDTEGAANIALLKKAPKGGFDNLYLTQQTQAHQKAWSLQKGYAVNGTDPALKQVAASLVPTIEQHLAQAKALTPAGVAS